MSEQETCAACGLPDDHGHCMCLIDGDSGVAIKQCAMHAAMSAELIQLREYKAAASVVLEAEITRLREYKAIADELLSDESMDFDDQTGRTICYWCGATAEETPEYSAYMQRLADFMVPAREHWMEYREIIKPQGPDEPPPPEPFWVIKEHAATCQKLRYDALKGGHR